jgi:hypothetical protein
LITLTLRPDPETENQYRAFNGRRYVGRIYQAEKDQWFWAVAFNVTAPANPPYGWHELSRDAAIAKLKSAYLTCLEEKNPRGGQGL